MLQGENVPASVLQLQAGALNLNEAVLILLGEGHRPNSNFNCSLGILPPCSHLQNGCDV